MFLLLGALLLLGAGGAGEAAAAAQGRRRRLLGRRRLLLLLPQHGERPLVEGERGLRALELGLVRLEVRAQVARQRELLLADVTAEGFVACKTKGQKLQTLKELRWSYLSGQWFCVPLQGFFMITSSATLATTSNKNIHQIDINELSLS